VNQHLFWLLLNSLFICEVYFAWYLTAYLALTCDSARKRCAAVLTNIARAVGQKVARGTEPSITNEELASAAGITLYDASRFMSEWQRSGALVKTRGKVLLRATAAVGKIGYSQRPSLPRLWTWDSKDRLGVDSVKVSSECSSSSCRKTRKS
jgi:hypothetical protein